MKRTSGGLHKRVQRMTISDNANTTDEGRHDETEIDPIKNDWHIFRGPPDYTHTSLPAIYVNNCSLIGKTFEAGIRLTSPYQPFFATTPSDINPGGGISTYAAAVGDSGFDTQYFGFYSQLYRYYSVISCRYHISVENYGGEPIWCHVMKYNQEKPPPDASNADMNLWRGVKSHYMTPFAAWYDTAGGTGGVHKSTYQYNIEGDTPGVGQDSSNNSSGVARKNNAVISISGQYNAGDFRQEVALDSEINTWTQVAANPTYPENLLLRFNTEEDDTGTDATTRDRRIQLNLRMEVEYLCEFKELSPEVRYPVRRNPITLTFVTGTGH